MLILTPFQYFNVPIFSCLDENEEKEAGSPEPSEHTTSRCIDCSRESWKTKRFTNVGMNTEISINPSTELDVGKISTNNNNNNSNNTSQTNTPTTASLEKSRHHVKPHSSSTYTQSSPMRPVVYKGMTPTSEYMGGVPLPTSMHNGKHTDEHEERPTNRSPASPTYGLDVYGGMGGGSSTQMRYPVTSMEQMHYEHFIPSHSWSLERGGSRYARSPPVPPTPQHRDHVVSSSRNTSPPQQHMRNRSPLSPRTADSRDHHHRGGEGYSPHYHDKHHPAPHHPHYEHRQPIHRGDERQPSVHRGDERHYEHSREEAIAMHKKSRDAMFRKEFPRELPSSMDFHTSSGEKPKPPQPQPAEEPPVFVLPNDFDAVSGIDPRLGMPGGNPMQERRAVIKGSPPPIFHERREHEKEQERSKSADAVVQPTTVHVKEEFQHSPGNNSTSSFSPKSGGDEGGESPDSSTPHTPGQKLFCKICNSVFPTKSLLYKHLRGHTSDEKPFKCSECGQGFTLSSNLRQHRIIHRGYKPFQCEFCGKKFMRSNVYKQHRRIHTGEEMHKCGLCPSEFLQKYALMKHMKKNHDIDTIEG